MRLLTRIVVGPAVAALVVALTCVATRSDAAPPDPHTQEASKHFQHGVELSEDGDWRAAVIEFERAYAIAPNFRVLYDVAACATAPPFEPPRGGPVVASSNVAYRFPPSIDGHGSASAYRVLETHVREPGDPASGAGQVYAVP